MVKIKQSIKNASFGNVFAINTLSIKKLTILGFTFVALPLILALIYSAAQVNQLSKQGAEAIFDVANLIKTNRELSQTLLKAERFASQYMVLKDPELMSRYLIQEQKLLTVISPQLAQSKNSELVLLSEKLHTATLNIHDLVAQNNNDETALESLQQRFKALSHISQKINHQSNDLINNQANTIKTFASQVSQNMLKSLLTIPIIILIAALFIFLITKPLKQLTQQIKVLEKGHFDKKIQLTGSPEIKEIADALEIMRTRLHALELQKSSFIRHISHELKTPLAAIREGTSLLYDNSVGQLNDEQQEICNIIRGSVNRLQRLIEELLDFNIVLDSTSLQDAEKVTITPLISSVLSARKLDIKRKNLSIKQHLNNIQLLSNTKQLSVILDNLLSNAIKYSPINGVIDLSTYLQGDKLTITISDQGPGIITEVQDNIFDAFYQGPAPQNTQIKGSGLGLTIVKELLMRLNGSITIDSQTTAPSGTKVMINLSRASSLGEKS